MEHVQVSLHAFVYLHSKQPTGGVTRALGIILQFLKNKLFPLNLTLR